MTAIGNVLRAGPSTPTDHLAFLMIGGAGDLEYYGRDNIAVDQVGEPIRMFGPLHHRPRPASSETRRPPVWWEGLTPIPAEQVQVSVLSQAGARPWDRDMRDVLLVAEVAEGRGEIIDHEREVGGYPPVREATRKPFNPDDWDLRFMTPLRDDVLDRPASRNHT